MEISPRPGRLAWITDPHFNFVDDTRFESFLREISATGAERVLLGGDIAEAPTLGGFLEALVSRLDRPIDFVLGNHDFYRSSIAGVRRAAREVSRRSRHLAWLGNSGVVPLTESTALVGHDGWGDARNGNAEESPITPLMTDHWLIEDLAGLPRADLLETLRRLGSEAATILEGSVRTALESHPNVLVLTHVPPFAQAAWHEGKQSTADWLPHFSCRAVGDALRGVMSERTDRRMIVLCGHTHSRGEAWILPNLRVLTGAAVYGQPAIERTFDADALFAEGDPRERVEERSA